MWLFSFVRNVQTYFYLIKKLCLKYNVRNVDMKFGVFALPNFLLTDNVIKLGDFCKFWATNFLKKK